MALSFPLSTAQFFDLLPIRAFRMKPADNRTSSETGGGEFISAGRGQRLWQGEVTLDLDIHAQIAGLDAKLSLLEEAGASFLMYDPRKPYPSADPDGSILSGSSPVIAELENNNQQMRISSLPGGYVITPGDLVGWTYGSNPVRYALHRVVVGGTADGSGLTPKLQVTPFIAPGAQLNAAVTLIRPPIKARLPQADYGAGRSVISEGGSFQFIQTRR